MKKHLRKSIIILFVLVIVASLFVPVLAEDEDSDRLVDVKKFEGKRIGVCTGTIYGEMVEKTIKDADIKYYKSCPDLLAALQADKVDAIVNDEPVIAYLIAQTNGVELSRLTEDKDYLAFGAAKNEHGEKLMSEFNEYFQKLKKSGEIKRLKKKWTVENNKAKLEDYTQYPATNGTLVIAAEAAFPPLEYVKDGVIVGYEIELVTMFCKEYGYKPEVLNVDFAGVIAGIDSGKYDIGASGLSITEERKKSLTFSDPVYVSGAAIAYKKEAGATAVGTSSSGIGESFYKTFIAEDRWKSFLSGIKVTLTITIVSIILGTLIGFISHILCRRGNKAANAISSFFNWLIKGLPEVVLLMILYYVIFGKSSMNAEVVAIIAFTLCFACSTHGMLKNAEDNLDSGQLRAATALGYNDMKAFFKIILPQTARMFKPNYLAEVSAHIKATAVVGYIAVVDITKVGDIVRGATYEAFFPLIAVAALYFILAALLRWIVKLLTRSLNFEKRSHEKILKGAVLR